MEQIGEILKKQTTSLSDYKLKLDAKAVYFLMLEKVKEELSLRGRKSFIMNEKNRHVIGQISLWYANDERFIGSLNKGIMLRGNVGTGKTVIVKALENTIISIQHNHPAFIHSFDLQDLYSQKEIEEKTMAIEALKSRTYTIIDDVGAENVEVKSFGNAKEPFIDIFDCRYRNNKKTIITTNLTPSQISERYGTRTIDRFKECMNDIILDGDSFRK